MKVLAIDKFDAGRASARVFSWNTAGAIVGAILAALWIVPVLKYEGAIKLAVITNISLALWATLFFRKFQFNQCLISRLVFTSLLLVSTAIFYKPNLPEAILRSSSVYALDSGEIEYYEVGRSATVVIIENEGEFSLRTNGLPEATINAKGVPPVQQNQRMLTCNARSSETGYAKHASGRPRWWCRIRGSSKDRDKC